MSKYYLSDNLDDDIMTTYFIKISTKEIRRLAFKDMRNSNINASIFDYAKSLREFPKELIIEIPNSL